MRPRTPRPADWRPLTKQQKAAQRREAVQSVKQRAKKPIKVSLAQAEALQQMASTEVPLQRWPGGFWTTAAPPARQLLPDGSLGRSEGRPPWKTTMLTVRALDARGFTRRLYVNVEAWRDHRVLSPSGLEASKQLQPARAVAS